MYASRKSPELHDGPPVQSSAWSGNVARDPPPGGPLMAPRAGRAGDRRRRCRLPCRSTSPTGTSAPGRCDVGGPGHSGSAGHIRSPRRLGRALPCGAAPRAPTDRGSHDRKPGGRPRCKRTASTSSDCASRRATRSGVHPQRWSCCRWRRARPRHAWLRSRYAGPAASAARHAGLRRGHGGHHGGRGRAPAAAAGADREPGVLRQRVRDPGCAEDRSGRDRISAGHRAGPRRSARQPGATDLDSARAPRPRPFPASRSRRICTTTCLRCRRSSAPRGRPLFFAGDLTTSGIPLEAALTAQVVRAGKPFVFVSGNHDSDTLARSLARRGAIVLTERGRLLADGRHGAGSWRSAACGWPAIAIPSSAAAPTATGNAPSRGSRRPSKGVLGLAAAADRADRRRDGALPRACGGGARGAACKPSGDSTGGADRPYPRAGGLSRSATWS